MKKWIVRQQDQKDCGVCCISSIIKYYNGYVPLEILKEDTYTNNEGVSAYHLVKTLKKYNFEAEGIRIKDDELSNINLPAIAHVMIDNVIPHFLVIYEIKKNYVLIMDPGKGIIKMNKIEWNKIFSGVIIICNPINKIISIDKPDNIIKLFKIILDKEKSLIIKIIISSLILTTTSIITSFFLKVSLNNIGRIDNYLSIKSIIVLFTTLYIIKIFTAYIRMYYEIYLNKNLDLHLTIPFLKHLYRVPLGNLKSRSLGDIIERVDELNSLKELFSKIFITIFLDFVLALSTLLILLNISYKLTIITLIILILYIIFGLYIGRVIKRSVEESIYKETIYKNFLTETLSGIQSIKNMNKSDYYFRILETKLVSYLKHLFGFQKLIINQNIVKEIINEFGLFILMVIGIFLIKDNKLSIINLITFSGLVNYLLIPVKSMIDFIPKIEYLKASYNKIYEFIMIKEEELNDKERFVNGNIEINNVSYSYNGVKNTINNLSLKIDKNEKILLMGNSGQGKSTLCKLMMRLMKIDGGEILINQINIEDYSINTIRDNISYISQDEVLFSDSIVNNLGGYNDNLHKIVKICQIEDILKNKPLRLNTFLLESGSNLSGGEKQRLILARGLLRNSQIIIMDEALSEVPENMARKILEDIIKFYKDKTIIYISHHEIINTFDRIIHLEDCHG